MRDGQLVTQEPTAQFDVRRMISLMVGRNLDQLYPERGRSKMAYAMPSIRRKFKTFHAFASATVEDIVGADKLAAARRLEATELASGRDGLKSELLNERRNRLFGAYMTKARDRMRVTTNPQLIAQVIG